jgi:hypothetical protein
MHNKIIILATVLFLSVGHPLFGQTDDRKGIEQTIQSYFDGWLTGDTTKVGYAMHASCKLKTASDTAFFETDRATYLSRFKPRDKPDDSFARIINIDITSNVASAKCQIETPKFLFTDYFNLMKIRDRWYIVDKVATRVAK